MDPLVLAHGQLAFSMALSRAVADAHLSQFGSARPSLSTSLAKLQRDLVSRELEKRSATAAAESSMYLRAAAALAAMPTVTSSSNRLFSPASSLLPSATELAFPSMRRLHVDLTAQERSISPQLISTVTNHKRAPLETLDEARPRKMPRLVSSTSSDSQSSTQQHQPRRTSKTTNGGGKTKVRDDFFSKVGKNNSHIHLVNILLGRLLNDHLKAATNGNRVLSNEFIQKVLDTQLYGKYLVRDFFASSVKAGETTRNTWTRLNFASDSVRSGLSKYKQQTWQAIERCGFDDVSPEDKQEMDAAIQSFERTGKFVYALEVALKGVITEEFIALLMKLRKEWNTACAAARPEEQESAIAILLSRYGLSGKE